MVWNRRARKAAGRNRLNPAWQWVWSTPVHQALVDLETFVRAQQIAEGRQRSRPVPGPNRHPQTKRVYRLRGYVVCTLCGRRIHGKPSGGTTYYVCAPKAEYRPEGHPPSIWIREDTLLDRLEDFLSVHLFGATRRQLIEAHEGTVDAEQQRERRQRLSSLRTAVADCAARSRRLVRNLQLLERPHPSLLHEIAARPTELRAQQQDLQQRLITELNTEAGEHERYRDGARVPLSKVPVTAAQLSRLPDEMSRPLFEPLQLSVRYDGRTGDAVCGIVLPFAVTNDESYGIPQSEAHAVRCEVAVPDGADAAALQERQL
ncbi:hypothetical protein QFZ76_006841 [Streptomyces sp. V4I2]|nr:hypothetical protein [Streptomyces sp. V4I2]